MRKGLFITVEGGEGSGKTSIVSNISALLQEHGREVVTSREPGGIAIAEQIRSVILDRSNTEMDGRTEALLYAAARRQHFVEKIRPALKAGMAVVCDRFIDSSLAYQGHARGLGMEEILRINEFASENVFPDLTLYLDVEPEVGLARIQANQGREVNRLDLESLAFHLRVREGYRKVAQRFPERVVTIDANGSRVEVWSQVRQTLGAFLSKQDGTSRTGK